MRRRIAAAATVVVLTGIWLGAFAVETVNAFAQQKYPLDFKGATWVGTAGVAPRAYFRLDVALSVVPDSATLWLDVDQGYSASVNRIGVDTDANQARAGAALIAHPVDITRQMTAGDNVIALQVSNWDGRTAAIRARLTIVNGVTGTDYLTGTAHWLATSDITQVTSRASYHAPRYSSVGFDPSGWPPARRIPAVRRDVPSIIPPGVMEAPLDAEVVAGPRQSTDITASVALDLPDDPTDAWFRIIAPGNYVLLLDGAVLTVRATPPPTVAQIYNLAPFLHRGHNALAIHVTADPVAMVYAEGSVELPNHPSIVVSTGHQWGVADSPADSTGPPPAFTGTDQGRPADVFPTGINKVVFGVNKLNAPPGISLLERIGSLLGVLAVWLLVAGAVAVTSETGFGAALGVGAAAQVPGAAMIAMLELTPRFAPSGSPFPYFPWVVALVVLALLIPQALAAIILVEGSAPLSRWPGIRVRVAWWKARWSAARSSLLRIVVRRSVASAVAGGEESKEPAGPVTGLRRVRWDVVLAWIRSHPGQLAITAIGVVCGLFTGYQLGYEPYWQDEIASLNAAQAMRIHILPQLPSTFIYWKGELYSAVIAVVGAVFNDQGGTLRVVTVLWYVATVLAFGLFLGPLILGPTRRVLLVATTFVFATSPVELTWARDVRMYQQAQFFTVMFLGCFLLALRSNRTRDIVASAVMVVAMYLSHEETFVFLPVIPVVFLAVMRMRWIRDRRWWLFGGGAFAIIGGQYLLTGVTHPPFYGFDHSNKPYIVFDPHNFFYYLRQVYFAVKSQGQSLMILSSLGVLASIVGVVRRSFRRLYLTVFLWIPVLALSTIFSPKISRYVYVTIPVVFLLGALGACDFADFLRELLTPLHASLRQAGLVRRAVAAAMLPGFVWVMCSVGGGVSSYGLAVSRLTGTPTARKHVDFDYAIAEVAAQIRPTDTVVTLCPPDIAAHYLNRDPDFIISTGRDKLLYLFDKGGQVVDTTYGAPQILSAPELQHLIEAHHRVWLITDQGAYLDSVDHTITQLIVNQFDEVSEGYGGAVYFRGE